MTERLPIPYPRYIIDPYLGPFRKWLPNEMTPQTTDIRASIEGATTALNKSITDTNFLHAGLESPQVADLFSYPRPQIGPGIDIMELLAYQFDAHTGATLTVDPKGKHFRVWRNRNPADIQYILNKTDPDLFAISPDPLYIFDDYPNDEDDRQRLMHESLIREATTTFDQQNVELIDQEFFPDNWWTDLAAVLGLGRFSEFIEHGMTHEAALQQSFLSFQVDRLGNDQRRKVQAIQIKFPFRGLSLKIPFKVLKTGTGRETLLNNLEGFYYISTAPYLIQRYRKDSPNNWEMHLHTSSRREWQPNSRNIVDAYQDRIFDDL